MPKYKHSINTCTTIGGCMYYIQGITDFTEMLRNPQHRKTTALRPILRETLIGPKKQRKVFC